jgi:hypothetical protein
MCEHCRPHGPLPNYERSRYSLRRLKVVLYKRQAAEAVKRGDLTLAYLYMRQSFREAERPLRLV